MTNDFSSVEEEAFDRLVKRALAEEWARFPAPSDRVWRALAVRLRSQAKPGSGAKLRTCTPFYPPNYT